MKHLQSVSKGPEHAETTISAEVKVEFVSEVLVAFGGILEAKAEAEEDSNTTS